MEDNRELELLKKVPSPKGNRSVAELSRLLLDAPKRLNNAELLAAFLRRPRKDGALIPSAEVILEKSGGFRLLLSTLRIKLVQIWGTTHRAAIRLAACAEACRRMLGDDAQGWTAHFADAPDSEILCLVLSATHYDHDTTEIAETLLEKLPLVQFPQELRQSPEVIADLRLDRRTRLLAMVEIARRISQEANTEPLDGSAATMVFGKLGLQLAHAGIRHFLNCRSIPVLLRTLTLVESVQAATQEIDTPLNNQAMVELLFCYVMPEKTPKQTS